MFFLFIIAKRRENAAADHQGETFILFLIHAICVFKHALEAIFQL